jgi:selenocysteine-specific elongation factor
MMAGASHINVALLVIAADEGVAVQTREHFDILRLLGIRRGLIALTKSDLVDGGRHADVEREVRNFVQGTFLESAPIIPVSAVTTEGLDELKAALMDIGRQVERAEDSGIFRLPIDRVFTVHGFGTVIAGTVLSGEIRAGDRIEIFPDRIIAKVRGVQVHNEKRDLSGIGNRTALNLQDIEKDLLRRGQCAAAPGSLAPTLRMDGRLRLLPNANEVKMRDRLRLHIGTDEVIARVFPETGSSSGHFHLSSRSEEAKSWIRWQIGTGGLTPQRSRASGALRDPLRPESSRYFVNHHAGR